MAPRKKLPTVYVPSQKVSLRLTHFVPDDEPEVEREGSIFCDEVTERRAQSRHDLANLLEEMAKHVRNTHTSYAIEGTVLVLVRRQR